MKFRISKVLSIISFFIATTFLFDSCKKETECNGEIKCVDLATGAAVPGATVKIYVVTGPGVVGFYTCDNVQMQEKTFTADAGGTVTFCLKYPATPSILVTAGAKTGSNVIATAPGETVSVTVKIQ